MSERLPQVSPGHPQRPLYRERSALSARKGHTDSWILGTRGGGIIHSLAHGDSG